MTKYGIYGSGTCGENIIEDGLADIGIEDNEFVVIFRKGATPSEDRVFDYLIENEATFSVIVDGAVPKVIADHSKMVNDIPTSKHAEAMLKTSDVLLILWDDEREQELTEVVFKGLDTLLEVKELSNGLAPFSAEPVVDDTPVAEPFTLEELRSMSIGVLRKAAAARGVEGVGAYEKDELIDLIAFDYRPKTSTSTTPVDVSVTYHVPEVASDIPSRVMSEYGEGSITWIQDGALCTEKLSASQIAWLIEELKHQPI